MIYIQQTPMFQMATPNGHESHLVALIISPVPVGMKLRQTLKFCCLLSAPTNS